MQAVFGGSPNVLTLQSTPLFKEGCWGRYNDEVEEHPGELSRGCLALAYDVLNSGINEIFN